MGNMTDFILKIIAGTCFTLATILIVISSYLIVQQQKIDAQMTEDRLIAAIQMEHWERSVVDMTQQERLELIKILSTEEEGE